jgi:hypothetical protein
MNGQYVIFFIPETSFYSFFDRFDRPPMRKIHEDEIICRTDTLTNAQLVTDCLNEQGLI